MKKSSALLACFALALSSCSSNAERDTSRKAVLDYSKNYIHLPLDEYAFDELTIRTVSTAWHTLMSECYAHHGQSYAVPSIDTPQPGGGYTATGTSSTPKSTGTPRRNPEAQTIQHQTTSTPGAKKR